MSSASPASVRSRSSASTAAIPPPQMTTRKRLTRPSLSSAGNHGVKQGGICRWQGRPARATCSHDQRTDEGNHRRWRGRRARGADRPARARGGAGRSGADHPAGRPGCLSPAGRRRAVRPRRGQGSYDLVKIARDHGAALHFAGVQSVDADARTHRHLGRPRRSPTRSSLVAVGRPPDRRDPRQRHGTRPGLHQPLPHGAARPRASGASAASSSPFPAGASWPLPLYELALMTAAHVAERGLRKVELSVVHAGAGAARAVRLSGSPRRFAALLEERGIDFHGGRYPSEVRDGELRARAGPAAVPADRVVSLPTAARAVAPRPAARPRRLHPVDLHGLVDGEPTSTPR